MIHEAAHNLLSRRFRLRPTALNLLVTARCNARCTMCNIWLTGKTEAKHDLVMADYQRVVESSLVECVHQVMLSGGEAMLRKDIVELVDLLATRLPSLERLTIATNALATDFVLERVSRIAALPVWQTRGLTLTVQFSFDSLTTAADTIRGPRASARVPATVDGLLALRRQHDHLKLSAGCVIQPSNLDDVSGVAEYLREKDIASIFTVVCRNEHYYGNQETDSLSFTAAQVEQVRQLLSDLARAEPHPGKRLLYRDFRGMLGGAKNSRGCPALRDALLIEANGNIVPCLNSGNLPVGNLRKDDLQTVWYSQRLKEAAASVQRTSCGGCMFACGAGYAEVLRDFVSGGLVR